MRIDNCTAASPGPRSKLHSLNCFFLETRQGGKGQNPELTAISGAKTVPKKIGATSVQKNITKCWENHTGQTYIGEVFTENASKPTSGTQGKKNHWKKTGSISFFAVAFKDCAEAQSKREACTPEGASHPIYIYIYINIFTVNTHILYIGIHIVYVKISV